MIGQGKSSNFTSAELHNVNQLLINHSFDPIGPSNSLIRVYNKASVNGKVFFSKENKRVKLHNSYTVAYSVPLSDSLYYGLIEKFIAICGYEIAHITECNIECQGPPRDFTALIKPKSQRYVFQDYITYKKGAQKFIFINQIMEKCLNLTNNNWKLLTLPVNDVEYE